MPRRPRSPATDDTPTSVPLPRAVNRSAASPSQRIAPMVFVSSIARSSSNGQSPVRAIRRRHDTRSIDDHLERLPSQIGHNLAQQSGRGIVVAHIMGIGAGALAASGIVEIATQAGQFILIPRHQR